MKDYLKWVEFKEPNELPDYDEYVLWRFGDGTCLWDALDKDGTPWVYGGEFQGFTYPPATHWMRIPQPDENAKRKFARMILSMADDVSRDKETAIEYLKEEGVDMDEMYKKIKQLTERLNPKP